MNSILLEPQCIRCWTELSQLPAKDDANFIERKCACRSMIIRVEDDLRMFDALTTVAEKTALLNGLVRPQYAMQGEGTRWARSAIDIVATCKAVAEYVEGCPDVRGGMKEFLRRKMSQ